MKSRKLRLFSLLLATILTAGMLTACKPKEEEPPPFPVAHTAANTTPLDTEVFADRPDQILYLTTEAEEFSAEEVELIYAAFTELMTHFRFADLYQRPFDAENVVQYCKERGGISFRYHQRRNYTGSLETDRTSIEWGNTTFDEILIMPQKNSRIVDIAFGESGTYKGMKDKGSHRYVLDLVLCFEEESNITDFISAVESCIG